MKNNKGLKYGSLFFIYGVVVIAIMVAVNMFAEIDKFDVKWDLTPNKMYSIGDQTKKLLSELKQDVTITFLADKDELKNIKGAGDMLIEYLDKYDKYPKVTVRYIDPDKNPSIIKELDKEDLLKLQTDNIVVTSGKKAKKVVANEIFYSDEQTRTNAFAAEQSITGAIKYVTTEKTPVVYFVEGHGERALASEYAGLKQILENGNYIVSTLKLSVEAKVPEDAEMLIFTGPKTDISKAEADRLTDYFKNNGNAIFLFDPVNSDKKFENFESVLNEYNISLNYDRVKEGDDQRHYPDDPYTFLPAVLSSDITGADDVSQLFLVLNDSRSINILNNEKEPLKVNPLLETTEKAIGESYGTTNGEDTMGPLCIGASAEYNSSYKSKIIVFGNAYCMTDDGFTKLAPYSENTMRYFLASLSWMRDTTNDLIIPPKSIVYDTVNLTSRKALVVFILSVLVIPLLIIGIGLVVWLRRRRL
jgi:ABC-2 type transport system permease protein